MKNTKKSKKPAAGLAGELEDPRGLPDAPNVKSKPARPKKVLAKIMKSHLNGPVMESIASRLAKVLAVHPCPRRKWTGDEQRLAYIAAHPIG